MDQLAVYWHDARRRFCLEALAQVVLAHVKQPYAFLALDVADAHLANLVRPHSAKERYQWNPSHRIFKGVLRRADALFG